MAIPASHWLFSRIPALRPIGVVNAITKEQRGSEGFNTRQTMCRKSALAILFIYRSSKMQVPDTKRLILAKSLERRKGFWLATSAEAKSHLNHKNTSTLEANANKIKYFLGISDSGCSTKIIKTSNRLSVIL